MLHGVYAEATHRLPPSATLQAALLVAPADAVVARFTAAALWGAVVPATGVIHLNLPPHARCRTAGIDARNVPTATRQRGQFVVSTPGHTFCDLATDLDEVDLVTLGDSMAAQELISPAQLLATAQEWSGRRAAVARRAAALVRVGVESPKESELRTLMVLGGLPDPVVNYRIYWPDGRERYRLDTAYPQVKIAVEYDGRQHAEDSQQWHRDIERKEWLQRNGWFHLVVTGWRMRSDAAGIVQVVHEELGARGWHTTVDRAALARYFPKYRRAS